MEPEKPGKRTGKRIARRQGKITNCLLLGLFVLALGCGGRDAAGRAEEGKAGEASGGNHLIVRRFFVGELLGGRELPPMYETGRLLESLGSRGKGRPESVDAVIEGARITKARRVDCGKFDLVLYDTGSGAETVGFIELKAGERYGMFTYGTELKAYLDTSDGAIQKFSPTHYQQGSSYQDGRDLIFDFTLEDGVIRDVRISFGI